MHKYFLIVAICFVMGATQVASSALATPTSAPLPAVPSLLKTVPCKETANGVPHCKLPDLTAGPSITVHGHVVTWGGHVALTDADVLPQFDVNGAPLAKPICYFALSYVLKNIGLGNAGPPATPTFKNEMRFDGFISPYLIGRQYLQSLAASTSVTMNTAVYLPKPGGEVDLLIDAGNAVAESDETNNIFFITYSYTGNCTELTFPLVVF
jgi:hypothetical protein